MRIWLEPLPDGSLANYDIRQAFISNLESVCGDSMCVCKCGADQVRQMPVDTHHLKDSGLGRVIMFLYKSSKETDDHRRRAKALIDKWSRPVFNLASSYHDVDPQELIAKAQASMKKSAGAVAPRRTSGQQASVGVRSGALNLESSFRTSYELNLCDPRDFFSYNSLSVRSGREIRASSATRAFRSRPYRTLSVDCSVARRNPDLTRTTSETRPFQTSLSDSAPTLIESSREKVKNKYFGLVAIIPYVQTDPGFIILPAGTDATERPFPTHDFIRQRLR